MKLILLILIFLVSLQAKELDKISLQLQWLHQFQFAGYYMAKERGFYAEVGLDVQLKEFKYGLNPIDEVISKRATYAIGRSSLIVDRVEGKDIKLISAIFQSSPLVMLTTKDSNITSIEDFRGKKIMATDDSIEMVSVNAMINQHKITLKELSVIENSFKLDDLINHTTDLMLAYISNEPFILQERSVEYVMFNPKDHGFDFYSDILFTSGDEVKNNQARVSAFKSASLRGWKYAFENIQESVELIFEKYNSQNKSKKALYYEAEELKKLAYYKTKELGHIDSHKIERIYDIYNVMGIVEKKAEIDDMIFIEPRKNSMGFTQEEKEYLKNKKELSVCVKKNWLPFESIKDDEFIGMSADYLNLFASKIGVNLKVVQAYNQVHSMKLLKKSKCELKPMMGAKVKISIPYKATKVYMHDAMALVTRIEQPFIADLNTLQEKKIIISKGLIRLKKMFKNYYPNMEIEEVENIEIALELIASEKAFGYVGTSLSTSYAIQKHFSDRLKIVNDFESIEFGIGVIESEPLLLSILNKVISSTTQTEQNSIYNKWVAVVHEKEPNYTIVWQLIGGFILILGVGLFFLVKQNRLKKELELKNVELDTYFSSINDGFAIADVENKKFIKCNKAFEKLTGYTQEELNDLTIEVIHPRESLPYIVEQFIKQAKGEIEVAMEIPVLHKNQTDITMCDISSSIYTDVDGKVFNVGIFRDITLKLKLQNELQELNTTLEKKVLQEIAKNQKKEQLLLQHSRLAQMGEMISMIAHQWRQPLGAISSTAVNLKVKLELDSFDMQTQEGVQRASDYFVDRLGKIEGYVKNLTTTIDDFRNFYKPNKDTVTISLENVIGKALNIIKASLLNDNIEIIEYYEDSLKYQMYEGEMTHVILNILKNAQDNFKEKSIQDAQIVLKTANGIISICDNGGGIQESIINKIFDPYFSTKDKKNGTGLGLYMSKIIVQDHHNGVLNVFNSNSGVCFEISIGSTKC